VASLQSNYTVAEVIFDQLVVWSNVCDIKSKRLSLIIYRRDYGTGYVSMKG
jgi:hypothetical protein